MRASLLILTTLALLLQGCLSRPEPHGRGIPGAHLYKTSCAGCHGADARGNGPVTPVIGVRPPDLTHIAARRHGTFPELEIFRVIDGQADLSAHGPRHMPIWGYEFFGAGDDETAHRKAEEKIDHLVSYLRSIQRPD